MLTETASASQVGEAAERWVTHTLEEGKEDQKKVTVLLKTLTEVINTPVMPAAWSTIPAPHPNPPLAFQDRASVVHLHKQPTMKIEGQ